MTTTCTLSTSVVYLSSSSGSRIFSMSVEIAKDENLSFVYRAHIKSLEGRLASASNPRAAEVETCGFLASEFSDAS